ncbi:MAG: type II secretion system F family protein, partial [Armatimonadota bacterium]
MARFEFVAQDGHGTRRTGMLEATDRSAAAQQLRERDLRPIRITAAEPEVERWAAGFLHRAFPVAPASLAQFFAQLAGLIRGGVTAHEAMREMSATVHDRRLARTADEMAPRLAEGAALADLFSRYPALFPGHVMALIRAGEELGGLPEVLQSLADQYETEAKVEARLRWVRLYYGAVLV